MDRVRVRHVHAPRVRERFGDTQRPEATARSLRRGLVTTDAATSFAAWLIAFWVADAWSSPLWHKFGAAAAMAAATLGLIGSQHLWASRVCQVRSVELARLARVAILASIGGYVADRLLSEVTVLTPWVLGGGFLFALLATSRALFAHWLKMKRALGEHVRPLVVIGSSSDCARVVELMASQPELGYRVVGYVGPMGVDDAHDQPWLGDLADVSQILHRQGVDSVLIVSGALRPEHLNQVTRQLLAEGIHVHLSSGLVGIAPHRLRSLPLGHDPVFYLERSRPSRLQRSLKRSLDLVLAPIAIVVLSPLMLYAVIVIKLGNRGPLLYRHTRVGRGGVPFTCFKFRTMTPESEMESDALATLNMRTGPLFKAVDDPRVIRGGAFLRASSIDELPQLFNVLNGTMSLVGPRPALPDENAVFDEELTARLDVSPGITGLWQVEARDNPAFSAYRRLDLFYIENWSIGLDLAILLRTVPLVASRAFRSSPDLPAADPSPAVLADVTD